MKHKLMFLIHSLFKSYKTYIFFLSFIFFFFLLIRISYSFFLETVKGIFLD